MKKIIFNLFLLTYIFCNLAYAKIDSVATLDAFIEDGQQNGYFPTTIQLNTFGKKNKLTEVDIEFRTLIQWNINAKCPANENEIILATGNINHSIVCNAGDTAGILGAGNDWVDDATGNDIYYPGSGDDIIDTGRGSDILIFDAHWGHDQVKLNSHQVNTESILGYDGSYPWKYSAFIIFGKDIERKDIVWRGDILHNIKTGDSIELNTKKVNVLFASDPANNMKTIPTQETIALENLRSESVFLDGEYLYLANGNDGFYSLNIKDSSNPIVMSKLVLPGRAMAVTVENDIAYVAQGDYYLEGKKGWVSIIDISDKSAPKLLKNLKFGNSIRRISVNNGILYIPDTHNFNRDERAIHIYYVKNPMNPMLLSSTSLKSYVGNMVYLNKRLYFTSSYRIKIMDVSNPKSPKMIKNHPLHNQKAYSLYVKDDLFLHTYKDHGMRLYRLENDQMLKRLCDIKTMTPKIQDFSHRNALIIENGLIYRAESSEGISISSISECRVLNVIPSQTRLWVNALVKIDNKLVSFYENNKGRVYLLQEDMIHEKKILPIRKSASSPIEGNKQSQDQLQTLLYKASTKQNIAEIKRLCQLGANPNMKGHEKNTPIEITARLGRVEGLKALLACGGKATKTSMFLAALTEKENAMKVLEKHGIPVTVRDRRGNTTLHYIAQDGSLDMVKYLIAQGVLYSATNKKGESPLTWANYGSNCRVIEYLETLYPTTHKKIVNKKCEIKKLSEELNRLKALSKAYHAKEKSHSIDGDMPTKMKIKTKQKGDILRMKFMFTNPMITPWQADRQGRSLNFIKHITVRVGERIVFDMSNSFNVSKNPIFKLKVKNFETDKKVTLLITDNQGKQESKSATIKTGQGVSPHKLLLSRGKVVDFRKTHPRLWKAKTIIGAAKALYGNVAYYEGNFDIKIPKIAANGGAVPLSVKSEQDLESIAILTDANPFSAIGVFSVPKGAKVDYSLKIKAKNDENIIVIIAKGRDGKYYKSIKRFTVARSGGNCS